EVRFRIVNLVDQRWGHVPWQVSPDGKRCVAVVLDKPGEERVIPHPFVDKHEPQVAKKPLVQAWDVTTGKLLWQRPFAAERAFFHLSFTPDSKKVAISSRAPAQEFRTEAQVWSMEDGAVQTTVALDSKGDSASFELTASGRLLQYHEHPRSLPF